MKLGRWSPIPTTFSPEGSRSRSRRLRSRSPSRALPLRGASGARCSAIGGRGALGRAFALGRAVGTALALALRCGRRCYGGGRSGLGVDLDRGFDRGQDRRRGIAPRRVAAAPAARPRPADRPLGPRLGRVGRRLVAGRAVGARDLVAQQRLDVGQVLLVLRRADHDRLARPPGAAGAADAVDIVLGVAGHVVIEHVADRRNVQPARRDVRSDQEFQRAVAEAVQRPGALRLFQVAVDRRRVIAVFLQGLGQRCRPRSCGCRR